MEANKAVWQKVLRLLPTGTKYFSTRCYYCDRLLQSKKQELDMHVVRGQLWLPRVRHNTVGKFCSLLEKWFTVMYLRCILMIVIDDCRNAWMMVCTFQKLIMANIFWKKLVRNYIISIVKNIIILQWGRRSLAVSALDCRTKGPQFETRLVEWQKLSDRSAWVT